MAARIRLRTGQFRKFSSLKGLTTDDAVAKAMGIDPGTLSRVLTGKSAPGERFIAGALTAFSEVDFEDLFEVVDDAAAA